VAAQLGELVTRIPCPKLSRDAKRKGCSIRATLCELGEWLVAWVGLNQRPSGYENAHIHCPLILCDLNWYIDPTGTSFPSFPQLNSNICRGFTRRGSYPQQARIKMVYFSQVYPRWQSPNHEEVELLYFEAAQSVVSAQRQHPYLAGFSAEGPLLMLTSPPSR